MGIILKFEARSRSHVRAPLARMPRTGVCEIIVLPCVRYERWADEGQKQAPAKKKPRKRKARSR